MACAPRASAPLVAAVTEAMTASRFFFEVVFASFSAARVFSTPSLKAVEEAALKVSTVDLTVSAAAIWGELLRRIGWMGVENRAFARLKRTAVISCCSAAVNPFLCSAQWHDRGKIRPSFAACTAVRHL